MGSSISEADNLVRALIIALMDNGTVTENQLLDAAERLGTPEQAVAPATGLSGQIVPMLADLGPGIARKLHGMRFG